MAITRPIVKVYQQFATLTVTPSTPDLNCLVVGPCYWIKDYPADSDDIDVGDFVKAPYVNADAPCSGTDGSSLGRPDPGSDYLVLAEPPNNASGAILDSSSVEVVVATANIELEQGIDGAVTVPAGGDNEFTSAAADFVATGVAAGDRIIMTKDNAELAANTVIKTVKEVVDLNTLKLTSTFKAAEVAVGVLDAASGNIDFRIEHVLTNQTVDSAYYAVVGQQITIKTGPTGLLLTYNSTTYPLNYAANIYVGYRSLRQDISSDLLTIDDTTTLIAALGAIDERNPLATGVSVALANTGTPIQAIAVQTDNLIGHQAVRDTISTRSDVYAIAPVTDKENGLTTANWVAVIAMWKLHCVGYADPSKSKYRIVLGSYDELPTEKSSAPASLVGYTVEDGAAGFPAAVEVEDTVFVDPASLTDFETDAVDSTHLLDVSQSPTGTLVTATQYHHLFSSSGYNGAKALRGVIGGKRLRTTDGAAFGAPAAPAACAYLARNPILKSENVAAANIIADATGCTWGADGGTKGRITKPGAFANVAVGDVAHVTDQQTTPAHDDGFYIIAVDASGNYIDVEIAEQTGDTVEVQVYRPIASSNLGNVTESSHTVTASGASDFANVGVGDMCVILQSPGVPTNGNVGIYVVQNKTDNQNIVIGDPDSDLEDDTAGTNVVFFRTVSANPDASVTVRNRLLYLRDDTASFITTVRVSENIEIPYPADTDPTKWDTATTQWPIETIMDDNRLLADLEATEELAPELFIAGFNGDMPYRISIDLDRAAQVEELNTIPAGLKSNRCVMAWPNECMVSGLTTKGDVTSSWQKGWYLACTIGGMIAGLPSHQGFTFIGIGGISQIRNSNTYFTDGNIDDLSEAGWYVFLQDSESSSPYSAHEVTTDTDTYEMGELMNVKNFDFIAMYYKQIMEAFLGRYNINTGTLQQIRESFNTGTDFLQLRTFPRIGAPLLDAEVTLIEQQAGEVDRVELFAAVDMPKVLNKIGLHLIA